ncbi:OmpA family protein [Bombella saccharophila]|uniref:OmpA family protein n=1 Tax=Bombella saccharophila TaxID=2967338 RepID=A0ABT3W495_9PROT|nr:OmpA family protein [Bombella saccharophila]MCX5613866.1 OmpA family protein [Bombella saccharophila]
MRIRNALLAMTSMVALPSLAMASTITGPYVDMAAGYNLVQHQSARVGTGRSIKRDATQDYGKMHSGTGFNGYLSAGYGFGNGLRLEVEGTYNQTHINRLTGTFADGGTRHAHGKSEGYGGFVNVLYDIDLGMFGLDNFPVTPFVGIGAGYMWQNYRKVYNRGTNYPNFNNTTGGLAAQGIVGAAYDIPGVPGLALTTQYRFIGQAGSSGGGSNGRHYLHHDGERGDRVGYGTRYTHQFLFGVRYAFNSAPPAPPAAPHVVVPPPAQAARTYLVFFDWDKSNLTGRAREIVAQAAQASTHVQTTRIEVNGYTDNSAAHPGPRGEKYNMGLSIKRANSVKAELVRLGVPATAIDIHGYGDANPLVTTAKNTREPQNRRVEIILK